MSKYGALGRTSALGQAEIVTKERDVFAFSSLGALFAV